MSDLHDFECRSDNATNAAVYHAMHVAGDDECAAEIFRCPIFSGDHDFVAFPGAPEFLKYPVFPELHMFLFVFICFLDVFHVILYKRKRAENC